MLKLSNITHQLVKEGLIFESNAGSLFAEHFHETLDSFSIMKS
jgi:hypothetical protein